jgi:hypothetical protein
VAGTDAKHQAPDDNAIPTRRRSRWWIPVLTFVAGIAVGVLIVGLLDTSTPDFSALQSTAPTTPSPAGPPPPSEAGARVNAACVRVINQAQDVATILSEVGPALSAVNLQQLDDIVRRLQSIQGRLDDDLRDCKVEADVSGTSSPASSPVPSPSATAEPSASQPPLPTASPTR